MAWLLYTPGAGTHTKNRASYATVKAGHPKGLGIGPSSSVLCDQAQYRQGGLRASCSRDQNREPLAKACGEWHPMSVCHWRGVSSVSGVKLGRRALRRAEGTVSPSCTRPRHYAHGSVSLWP